MDLHTIEDELRKVEHEIGTLEDSLAGAKQRRQQLQQKRNEAANKKREIEAYEAKISAIKQQIAETEAAKAAATAEQTHDDEEEEYDDEEYEEVEEYEEIEEYEEEEIFEEIEEEELDDGPIHGGSTAAAMHANLQTNPSQFDYSAARQEQLDALKKQNQWSRPEYAQPTHATQTYENHKTPGQTFLTDQRAQLQQKYQFEKPAWASHNSADTAVAIDDTPIQNPLLKTNNASGYTRQVFEKSNLHRSDGKFVAPREKVPPRLAWIVVDINKKKAGKIVLHLHGLGTDQVVEHFPNLVGMTLERQGNTKPIFVEEMSDPKFYITTNSKIKDIDGRKDVYGLVQEGKEVVAAIKNADEHAGITIRQSHVFPVKKAK